MRLLFLLLVFLYPSNILFGQVKIVQSGQPVLDKSHINSLTTFQNKIWLATLGGLIKLDKTITQHTELTDSDILPGEQVFDIITAGNAIWITGNSGIASYDGKTWKKYDLEEPSLLIREIAIDSTGNIWIAGNVGFEKTVVIKWQNEILEKFDNSDGLFIDLVTGLAIDEQGQVWLSTHRGVNKYDGEKWYAFDSSNGLDFDFYTGVVIDNKNQVWVSSKWKGLNILKNNGWDHIAIDEGPNMAEIKDLTLSEDGLVFAVSDKEFSSFDNNEWLLYKPELAEDQIITTLNVDKENYYIGTTNGIIVYPRK